MLLFLAEEAGESACRFLRMKAEEGLLLYYRLVVVDVVAVLVAERAVRVVGLTRGLERDGERDAEHHGQHYQDYYQQYHW